jgi:hypothetical protein
MAMQDLSMGHASRQYWGKNEAVTFVLVASKAGSVDVSCISHSQLQCDGRDGESGSGEIAHLVRVFSCSQGHRRFPSEKNLVPTSRIRIESKKLIREK